jgi:hypothetical protein
MRCCAARSPRPPGLVNRVQASVAQAQGEREVEVWLLGAVGKAKTRRSLR